MGFYSGLLTTTQVSAEKWLVETPFTYYLTDDELGPHVGIPRHFPTDGATVPRIFWVFYPPMAGKYSQAAVVHDYLYNSGVVVTGGVELTVNRKAADKLFRAAMKDSGVSWKHRNIIYYSIRFRNVILRLN